MVDMLEVALTYAASGWSVFPCHYPIFKGEEVTCSCGRPKGKGKGFCESTGKHPRTAHGFYDATRDESIIKEWWKRNPLSNIGLPTGVSNNLLAVDVDTRYGGDKSLAELEALFEPLPLTRRVATGSGGEHILYKHVEGLANCVGAVGDGLDIRTQGGYIVGVPSLHPSGKRYDWSNEAEIIDAPVWLVEEIKKRGGGESKPGRGGQFDYWLRISKGVQAGERHVSILKLAGLLIGDKRLPATLALSLVHAFNAAYCEPILEDDAVNELFSRVVKRQVSREFKR